MQHIPPELTSTARMKKCKIPGKQLWIVVLLLSVLHMSGSTKLCVSPASSPHIGSEKRDPQECHTLEEYVTKYNSLIQSNTVLQFLSGTHNLSTTFNITRKLNVSLLGCARDVTIRCTGENSGIIFSNSTENRLTSLKLIGCRAIAPLKYKDRAALIVIDGTNFTLTNVTIQNALNAGILLISINETTFISRLNILNTNFTSEQRRGSEIAYYKKKHTNYKLVIQDSTFADNKCYEANKKNRPQVSGLVIRVSGCNAAINVTRSEFRNNSGTAAGGNLMINMVKIPDISKVSVNLSNLLIIQGNAPKGGGLYLFITKLTKSNSTKSGNFVKSGSPSAEAKSYTIIENVNFTRNVATILGAALYTQLKASPQTANVQHIISVRNCTFDSNKLRSGKKGGIAIHNNYFDIDSYLSQFTPQYMVNLCNCTFQNHSIVTGNNKSGGNSVIFINTHDHFEITDTTITNNSVNAVTAVSSNLVLKGNITLSYNNGSSGGGLLLCEGSTIYLTPNMTMWIHNNHVKYTGGGICVEESCLIDRPKCFFQVTNEIKLNPDLLKTTKIHIYNNKADYGGADIYGGNIDFCYLIDSPEKNRATNQTDEVFGAIFNVSNATVTSPPRQICFCDSNGIDCAKNSTHATAYPGEIFQVSMVLVGQLNGTVPGNVKTSLHEKNVTVQPLVQFIPSKCTPINYTVNGDSGNTTLQIRAQLTRDQSGYERLRQYKEKSLKVTLKSCPVGFDPAKDDENSTACSTCTLHFDDLECHVKRKVFMKRKQGANTWIGFEYEDNTTAGMPTAIKYNENCPFDYCRKEEMKLHLNMSVKAENICANNRTGIMCGTCKELYSSVLGSSKCEICSNRNLIPLLITFAFAGLFLVAVLTLLNLTIAEGTLSGLIFYANIIECNSSFIIPSSNHYSFPTPIFRVFIAWINLDLGITTCFFDGMDDYTEAWLQFVFPLYIWSISIVIILLTSKFQVVARIASRNAVKVLATLVLLSYATFTYAVVSAFSFSRVHTLGRDNSTETVWLLDGNLTYFGFKHALLFATALCLGLLTLPLILALLFIKHLQRFSHKRAFRWVERLKPFLDAFTGPYTNNGRFWPGLLLLARICLSTSGGLNTLSSDRVTQGVTSLVIIILLCTAALVRPGLYTVHALDALEYFFFLNLTVLFIGSLYYDGHRHKQKIVFDSTVGLAFAVFTAIVLYHLLLKVRGYASSRIVAWLNARLRDLKNFLARRKNRAHIMRNYPPYHGFNQDREPLLSDYED